MKNRTCQGNLLALLLQVATAVFVLVVCAGASNAQTSSEGSTPSGAAPGAPVGSQSFSDVESINLFNGHLNVRVPIMGVGGRGSALTGVTMAIDHQWSVKTFRNTAFNQAHYEYYPELETWATLKPGYGPGIVVGRRGGEVNSAVSCGDIYDPYAPYTLSLTRLTVILPNGTEYELRDQLSGVNGQPLAPTSSYSCFPVGRFRGRVFVSADGSAATFISDSDIYDAPDTRSGGRFLPTGNLMLRDGSKHRVEAGLIKSIRDRTGNVLTFVYGGDGKILSITDTLGRVVNMTYDVNDGEPYGVCDRITYKGFGGVDRIVRISKTNLHNALRSGYSIQTDTQLFSHSNGGFTVDPIVTSSVWLPNGQRYRFFYNSYVEVARLELPTGGAVEYDYGGFEEGSGDGFFYTHPDQGNSCIYRRLLERRVSADGVTWVGKTRYYNYETADSALGSSATYVYHLDPSDALISAQIHYFHGQALQSMVTKKPTDYSPFKEGREYKTEFYEGGDYGLGETPGTLLTRITREWQQRGAVGWWRADHPNSSLDLEPANDPRLVEIRTTRSEPIMSQPGTLTTIQRFAYDRYNNQTDIYETTGYSTEEDSPFPSPLERHRRIEYLTINPQNGIDYTSPDIHLRNLPISGIVYSVTYPNVETVVSASEIRYDEPSYAPLSYTSVTGWLDPGTVARGNATTTRTWLNSSGGSTSVYPNGTYLESHIQYDQCGNVRNIWDARNKQASIVYDDAFSDDEDRHTYTFPTATTAPAVPDPDNPNATLSMGTSSVYDFSTGLLLATTDANARTISYNYDDPLNRLKKITRPTGGGFTTYEYGDTVGSISIRTLTIQNANQTLEDYEGLDGLGRPTRNFHYLGDSTYQTMDTRYDARGRIWKVSNPYLSSGPASASNPSGIWTTTSYDGLGRRTTVIGPDGSQVVTSYTNSIEAEATAVTVTDPAGRSRRQLRDALGRVIRVDEPDSVGSLGDVEDPLRPTYYSYDKLDRLVGVRQYDPDYGSGYQQNRTFVYDSLSRLTSANNPENGTVAYQYDENSNLVQRTDARGVGTTNEYDALNRIISRTYSDATPAVTYTYDSSDGDNCRGRLKTVSSSVSSSGISDYDAMGRARSLIHSINGHSYGTVYTYDLIGNVVTKQYSSGHEVHYSYDAGGRMTSMTGNLGDGIQRNYSTEMVYSPFGALSKERFGTGTPIYNKRSYNVRGQLAEIRAGTTYTGPGDTSWNRGAIINFYGTCGGVCTNNNGNITRQEHWVPGDDNPQPATVQKQIEEYEYDWSNRVQRAHEGDTWQQRNIYDRFGNRTIDMNNTSIALQSKGFEVEFSTNRLLAPGDLILTGANLNQRRMRYDAAGNMINDSYTGSGERTYDAENRMTTARGGLNSSWQTYSYDGAGFRVKRSVDGTETWQIYGIGGELVSEYAANASIMTPLKEYGYRDGQLLITAEPPIVTAPAPSSLSASPASSSVALNWSAASGASKYRIERRAANSGYVLAGTTMSANFTDHDVEDDAAYLYRVCAANNQDNCISGYSNVVLGATFGFPVDPIIISSTDDPSGATVTTMKAEHITKLRGIVNAVRSLAGLPAATWTYANVATGGFIHVEDVRDLRERLGEARTVLGMSPATYTDPTLKGFSEDPLNATPIKAAHIRELRQASTRGAGTGGGGSGFSTPNIHWLVSDRLGTPRMIFDASGGFASVSRHDYLPFGEELFAGSRSTEHGYTNNDGARQKFTQKERDAETGLDFFSARYYSSASGRFTSPDQPFADQGAGDPQSWNLYSYVRNQPTTSTDPLGLWQVRSDDGDDVMLMADPGDNLSTLASFLSIPLQTLQQLFPWAVGVTFQGGILWSSSKAFLISLGAQIPGVVKRDAFETGRGDHPDDTPGPGSLFGEFLFGNGQRHREFGAHTWMTKMMRTSPEVATAREMFLKCAGEPCTRSPSGLRSFGPWVRVYGWGSQDNPARSALDRNNARQFVGSFTITIIESDAGYAAFTIKNVTGVESGSYHTLPDATWKTGPLSNTSQTYFWYEKFPK